MKSTGATYRHLIGTILVVMVLLGSGVWLTGCTLAGDTSDGLGYDEYSTGDEVTMESDLERAGEGDLDAATAPEEYAEESVAGAGADASTVPAKDRLIIRDMGMRLKVDDVAASVEDIRSITSSAGGTISALHMSSDEDPVYRYEAEGVLGDGAALSGYITARVPAEALDAYVDDISALGEVVRVDASESDVTQEHIDLSARLKNLEAREARLRELYDEATTVEETLAVDRELSVVRSDIEAMKAQIAYLERQAAMATVTIELTGPTAIVRPQGEDWGFGDALTSAARAFMGMINGMIVVAGALLPLALLALLIGGVVWLIVRAIRRRTQDDDSKAGSDA